MNSATEGRFKRLRAYEMRRFAGWTVESVGLDLPFSPTCLSFMLRSSEGEIAEITISTDEAIPLEFHRHEAASIPT